MCREAWLQPVIVNLYGGSGTGSWNSIIEQRHGYRCEMSCPVQQVEGIVRFAKTLAYCVKGNCSGMKHADRFRKLRRAVAGRAAEE